jgi:hypothetical protein
MGGKVSVDSTVDVGTTFTIELSAKAINKSCSCSDYLDLNSPSRVSEISSKTKR